MQVNGRLIISNTLWSAGAKGTAMVANFLLLPVLIKNFGLEVYGIWVLSAIMLGYLEVFDFGFTQGLQKYIARARAVSNQQELSRVVVSGTFLLFGLGLIIGSCAYWFAPQVVAFFGLKESSVPIAVELIRIGAFFAVIIWPLKIVRVVLTATMHLKQAHLLFEFGSVLQTIILIVLIYVGVGVVALKWVACFIDVFVLLVGIRLLFRYVPELIWKFKSFSFVQIKRMYRFSFGLFYSSVLVLLSHQVDQLIIAKLLAVASVASYVVVTKPFFFVQGITQMMFISLNPVVHNLNAMSDRERLAALIREGIRLRATISLFGGCLGALFLPEFIELWMGPGFSDLVIWGQLYMLIFFSTCFGVLTNVTKNSGMLGFCNMLDTIKTLFNVVVSIALVHFLGVGGPIIGSVAANIILGDLIFSSILFKKMELPTCHIYTMYLKLVACACSVLVLGFTLKSVWSFNQWHELIFVFVLLSIVYAVVLCLTGNLQAYLRLFRQALARSSSIESL